MANYDQIWRTNRFKVRDDKAFEEWLDRIPDLEWEKNENGYLLMPDSASEGYLPGNIMQGPAEDHQDGDWEDYIDFDFVSELADHVAEDSTCILMECGHEKLRYVSGFALAIRGGKDLIKVSLDDIYEKAKEAWGDEPRLAEYEG